MRPLKTEFVMKRLEDIMQHACTCSLNNIYNVLLLAYYCIISFFFCTMHACIHDFSTITNRVFVNFNIFYADCIISWFHWIKLLLLFILCLLPIIVVFVGISAVAIKSYIPYSLFLKDSNFQFYQSECRTEMLAYSKSLAILHSALKPNDDELI